MPEWSDEKWSESRIGKGRKQKKHIGRAAAIAAMFHLCHKIGNATRRPCARLQRRFWDNMAGAILLRKGLCNCEQLKHIACGEYLPDNRIGAADFTKIRKIDRSFFVIWHFPRCRSPPHLKSGLTSMISEQGGLSKKWQRAKSTSLRSAVSW